MPLRTGNKSIRNNVKELMGSIDSSSRKKAIETIAKKHGISFQEAQFRQAKRIAESMSRK